MRRRAKTQFRDARRGVPTADPQAARAPLRAPSTDARGPPRAPPPRAGGPAVAVPVFSHFGPHGAREYTGVSSPLYPIRGWTRCAREPRHSQCRDLEGRDPSGRARRHARASGGAARGASRLLASMWVRCGRARRGRRGSSRSCTRAAPAARARSRTGCTRARGSGWPRVGR